MRKSVSILLGEMQGIMSGYVALMNYKFLNLCVKAEAASLLSVTVEFEDESLEIEDAADVTIPQENQLQVYPKDPALLFALGKAIAEAHPEFKQDIVTEKSHEGQDDADEDDNAEKSIVLTMPVVNKDRHDLLIDGIGALYEATKVKLNGYSAIYMQKATGKLIGALPEEMDEAKKALEDIHNQHLDMAKQYYDDKKEEIETAYELYLKEQNEKAAARQEQEAATNKDAGQSFRLSDVAELPTD